MRVAIVGAGAMGGVWAARLGAGAGASLAGTSVYVVDVSEELVNAISSDGLIVQGKDAAENAPLVTHPAATTRPAEVGPVDTVFVFVKAQHTAGAAALARPLVGPDTTVVSLQNGWGNSDVLAGVFPPDHLVMGVTYHSATVLAPGRVMHSGQGPTFIGPYVDGAPIDRAEAVRDLMADGGIEATVTPDVKTEVWKKLILNAATLPTAALTGLRSGELGQPGPMRDLLDAVAAEAVQVARARGYDIALEERIERIHTVLSGAGAGKASMLQDAEARRKTEIEVINGAVVRAAAEAGIDVPLNKAMVALVGGLERAWASPHAGAGAGGGR